MKRKVYYANIITEESYPSSIKKVKIIANDVEDALNILDKQYPNIINIHIWHTLEDYKIDNKGE